MQCPRFGPWGTLGQATPASLTTFYTHIYTPTHRLTQRCRRVMAPPTAHPGASRACAGRTGGRRCPRWVAPSKAEQVQVVAGAPRDTAATHMHYTRALAFNAGAAVPGQGSAAIRLRQAGPAHSCSSSRPAPPRSQPRSTCNNRCRCGALLALLCQGWRWHWSSGSDSNSPIHRALQAPQPQGARRPAAGSVGPQGRSRWHSGWCHRSG